MRAAAALLGIALTIAQQASASIARDSTLPALASTCAFSCEESASGALFPTRSFPLETQHHSYAQQRWYAPEVGRFLSEDPIGASRSRIGQGRELDGFGYAATNPTRWLDPNGRVHVGVGGTLEYDKGDEELKGMIAERQGRVDLNAPLWMAWDGYQRAHASGDLRAEKAAYTALVSQVDTEDVGNGVALPLFEGIAGVFSGVTEFQFLQWTAAALGVGSGTKHIVEAAQGQTTDFHPIDLARGGEFISHSPLSGSDRGWHAARGTFELLGGGLGAAKLSGFDSEIAPSAVETQIVSRSGPFPRNDPLSAGAAGENGELDTTYRDWTTTDQIEGMPAAGGGAGHPTLRPGPHAGESIPARSTAQRFTPAERVEIDRIGQTTGCHTCGTTDPGTKSGHFVPDHQPASASVPEGTPQRLYPQCIKCSREQGLELARQKRGQ